MLRGQPPFKGSPLLWSLFDVFFICIYQMGLVLLMVLPIVFAWTGDTDASSTSASASASVLSDLTQGLVPEDYCLSLAFLGAVAYEAVADGQQFVYQTEKYRRRREGEASGAYYEAGFITTGTCTPAH